MRFHLLAAAQMGPQACTLPYAVAAVIFVLDAVSYFVIFAVVGGIVFIGVIVVFIVVFEVVVDVSDFVTSPNKKAFYKGDEI